MQNRITFALLGLLALAVPRADAQNLIPNSSFEVGGCGEGHLADRRWTGYVAREGVPMGHPQGSYLEFFYYVKNLNQPVPTMPPRPEELFTPVAKYGRTAACGMNTVAVNSGAFKIPPGRYMLSFYVRGDVEQSTLDTVRVLLGTNPATPDELVYIVNQTVTATEQWMLRTIGPFDVAGGVNDLYLLEFRGDDQGTSSLSCPYKLRYYIDAVQLESGSTATPYKAMKPVEFGLATDRPHNVFEPSHPLALTVQTYNSSSTTRTANLELITKDFRDREIARQEVTLPSIVPGLNTTQVTVQCDISGSVRFELYQKDGAIEDELVGAVLPALPIQDRALGVQMAFEVTPVYSTYLGLKYGGGDVVRWDWVQPESGDSWDWAMSDAIVDAAVAAGVQFRTVYLWGYSIPAWAKSKANKNRPWTDGYSTFDLDDWSNYVRECIRRYKDRIKSWDVWNEPYYMPASSYIAILQETRNVVKQEDPTAEICGTDIPPLGRLSWITDFRNLGGPAYLDALSSHAYDQDGGYLPENIWPLTAEWNRYDGRTLPVYDSENQIYPAFTYTSYTSVHPANVGSWTNPGGPVVWSSDGYTAEEGAARWTKLVVTQHAIGIESVQPHYPLSYSNSTRVSRQHRGGPEFDGAWTPHMAAWAVAGRMIGTAAPLGEVQGPRDLRMFLFEKDGNAIAALWTRDYEARGEITNAITDGTFRSPAEAALNRGIVRKIRTPNQSELYLNLPSGSFEAYDIMGNRILIGSVDGKSVIWEVCIYPIYLKALSATTSQLRAAMEGSYTSAPMLSPHPGVDKITDSGGTWGTEAVTSNSYLRLARDSVSPKRIYGINILGGIDTIYSSGSAWTTQVVAPVTTSYTDVAADGVNSLVICAGKAAGGIDVISSVSGSWQVSAVPGNSTVYKLLTADSQVANKLYGAKSGGGMDCIYKSRGVWYTQPMPLVTGNYVALCSDSKVQDWLYGIRAGGGADFIYWAWDRWNCYAIPGAGSYTAIAASATQDRHVYCARTDGGVDLIYYKIPEHYWQASYLPGTYAQYTAIVSHSSTDYAIYCARTDGGVDRIQGPNIWDVTTMPGNVTKYSCLTRDAGTADGFYGSGSVYSVATLVEAKTFADLYPITCSGIVTAAFSGYFYIESPDRTSGIRVEKSGYMPAIGRSVTVTGIIGSLESGERYVKAGTVTELD